MAAREKALTEGPPSILSPNQTASPSSFSNPVTKKEPPLKTKSSIGKKDQKTLLKGVIKKKSANTKSSDTALPIPSDKHLQAGEKRTARAAETGSSTVSDDGPDAKRIRKGDTQLSRSD